MGHTAHTRLHTRPAFKTAPRPEENESAAPSRSKVSFHSPGATQQRLWVGVHLVGGKEGWEWAFDVAMVGCASLSNLWIENSH